MTEIPLMPQGVEHTEESLAHEITWLRERLVQAAGLLARWEELALVDLPDVGLYTDPRFVPTIETDKGRKLRALVTDTQAWKEVPHD